MYLNEALIIFWGVHSYVKIIIFSFIFFHKNKGKMSAEIKAISNQKLWHNSKQIVIFQT